jgi:hypothetical protein
MYMLLGQEDDKKHDKSSKCYFCDELNELVRRLMDVHHKFVSVDKRVGILFNSYLTCEFFCLVYIYILVYVCEITYPLSSELHMFTESLRNPMNLIWKL